MEENIVQEVCPNPQENIKTQQPLQVRPLRRYFARYSDYLIFGIFIGFLFQLIYPDMLKNVPIVALEMALLFAWVFIEAILLSTFGTTFGKYIFNVKIRDENGQKLNLLLSLKRSLKVWINGLGLGLPFISLITLIISYDKLKTKGITSWDSKYKCLVSYEKIGIFRKIIIVFICIITAVLICIHSLNSSKIDNSQNSIKAYIEGSYSDCPDVEVLKSINIDNKKVVLFMSKSGEWEGSVGINSFEIQEDGRLKKPTGSRVESILTKNFYTNYLINTRKGRYEVIAGIKPDNKISSMIFRLEDKDFNFNIKGENSFLVYFEIPKGIEAKGQRVDGKFVSGQLMFFDKQGNIINENGALEKEYIKKLQEDEKKKVIFQFGI